MKEAGSSVARSPFERSSLTEEDILEFEEMFNLFDTKGNGIVNLFECMETMKSLNLNTKNPEIYGVIEALSNQRENANGITSNVFICAIKDKLEIQENKEGLQKMFNLFDTKGQGKITFEELKRVNTELKKEIPDEKLQEMI